MILTNVDAFSLNDLPGPTDDGRRPGAARGSSPAVGPDGHPPRPSPCVGSSDIPSPADRAGTYRRLYGRAAGTHRRVCVLDAGTRRRAARVLATAAAHVGAPPLTPVGSSRRQKFGDPTTGTGPAAASGGAVSIPALGTPGAPGAPRLRTSAPGRFPGPARGGCTHRRIGLRVTGTRRRAAAALATAPAHVDAPPRCCGRRAPAEPRLHLHKLHSWETRLWVLNFEGWCRSFRCSICQAP